MNKRSYILRMAICFAVSAIAAVFGVYNILHANFVTIADDIIQAAAATVCFTALGEFLATLSKAPIVTYVITAAICAVGVALVSPWALIIPRADFYYTDMVKSALNMAKTESLVTYSAAFVLTVLIGVFVLHRKEIFRKKENA